MVAATQRWCLRARAPGMSYFLLSQTNLTDHSLFASIRSKSSTNTNLNTCTNSGWGSNMLRVNTNWADKELQCKKICSKRDDCIGSYVARAYCPYRSDVHVRADWCDRYRMSLPKFDKGYSAYATQCVLYFKTLKNINAFPHPHGYSGSTIKLGNIAPAGNLKCTNNCGPRNVQNGFKQCYPDATENAITGAGGQLKMLGRYQDADQQWHHYTDSQEGTCWAKE